MSRCLSRIKSPTLASGRAEVDVACQLDEGHESPHQFFTWANTYCWKNGDVAATVAKSKRGEVYAAR